MIVLTPLCFVLYYTLILLYKRGKPISFYKIFLSFVGGVVVLMPGLALLSYASLSGINDFYNIKDFCIEATTFVFVLLCSIWFYKFNAVTLSTKGTL